MPKPSGKKNNRRFQNNRGMRRNDRIRAPEVRVIGPNGKNIGVIPTKEAQRLASEAGLDLIEISPTARPPVCRILDYGKYIYEESKKKKDQTSTKTKLKEVKFRVGIDVGDFETKLRRAEGFLYAGNKVKFTLTFRGRENEHKDLGVQRMHTVSEMLEHIAVKDAEPKLAGRNVIMMMSPVPQAKRTLKFNHPDDELDHEDDSGEDHDEE